MNRDTNVKSFDYVLDMMQLAVEDTPTLAITGRVTQVIGTIIKAVVPSVKIGEVCILRQPGEDFEMKAEVVGFARDAALLTPLGDMYGISASTEVIPTGRSHVVPVGPGLLGRVLDGLGQPLDFKERGPLEADRFYPVFAEAPDPLTRRVIQDPLPLGVRAIDGLLTCGEGQRMGIFAAAGGGKSTLMGMLVKGAEVDVTVIALIGERGREVREFIERDLGPQGLAKSVVDALLALAQTPDWSGTLTFHGRTFTVIFDPTRESPIEATPVKFAAPLADRFYVMEHGQIVEAFPAAELEAKSGTLNELLGV